MVECMIASNDRRKPGLAFFAVLFLFSGPIHAETLPDPTRPSVDAGQSSNETTAPSGPVLQSVLISPERKAAIISGKTVLLGEKFGDAVLVRIGEGEVTLRTGGELKTLKLFPGVTKRAVKPGKVP